MTIGLAFAPTMIENYVVENPVTPPPSSLFTVLMWIGYILIVPCIALGALAVAFRYRRARGIERQQLEWLVFGAGVAAFLFAVAFAFTISGTERAVELTSSRSRSPASSSPPASRCSATGSTTSTA